MNILYCESLKHGNLGTHASHIIGVVHNLRKLGHTVELIREEDSVAGAGLDLVQKSSWGRLRDRLIRSRILKPVRGGGVILYLLMRDFWNFLQVFAILLRKKPGVDIIYRRDHLFNGEYFLGKIFKIPVIKEVNGITIDELKITGQVGKVGLRVYDKIDRFNMPKADKFIVVTPKIKEALQKEYGVPGDKIFVISNGANTDLFKPMDTAKSREKLGLNQGGNYICFVGAFHAWQGIENIINSLPLVLQKCPDTRLLLVGDGVMKQELVNLAEQVGVADKIMFTGMVPYQQVPSYINASDVCLSPKEGLKSGYSPLKLCEYMACGKPVIGSRASGLEIVEDSGGGILVEPKDTAALAAAVIKLLQNQDLREQMGKDGGRYVVANMSWESVASRVADVCQSVIDNKRSRGN